MRRIDSRSKQERRQHSLERVAKVNQTADAWTKNANRVRCAEISRAVFPEIDAFRPSRQIGEGYGARQIRYQEPEIWIHLGSGGG